MPSQYDAYKVKDLVNQYKANPDMFSEDQLDELEQLAEENEIAFKRQHSEFSIMRAFQQASAGFIEGFTTLDLIPKEPRNTGEAIFRQLGHLAGFAPSILKAPVVGLAKAISLGTGKKTKDILSGKVASSVMKAIDFVGPKSIPMIVSHKTQRMFNKGIEKTGMDALEYMKRGATTRAIAEEAVGLAGASAVSSIWKGPDAIVDSFIGGAIAGGAFGGIGNFANISRYHKGTPAQVEKANKILRTGLGSMVTGLPATLRGEPTEMQIYEYLLGGFFGYNTRPAREQYASKWLMDEKRFTNRDGSAEILDPRSAKDWSKVNKEAQDYIMYEHPMPKDSEAFKNSGEYGGTTGQALGWLEHHLPETNWKAKASKSLGENATEKQLRDWYGGEASHLYKSVRYMNDIVNKAVKEASDKNDDQANDYNDPIDIIETGTTVKEVAKKLYNKKSIVDPVVINSETKLAEKIQKAKIEHSKDGIPYVERFITDVKKSTNLSKGQEIELRAFFNKDAQPTNEVWYLKISQQGKERHFSIHSGKDMMIGTGDKQVAIGEKYYEMPINKLSGGGFQLLTHFENKGLPNKILRSFVNSKEGEVQFALDNEAELMLHSELYSKGKYVFSGVKDKNQLMVAPLIKEINGNVISKDMVFDSISSGNEVIRKQLEFAFEHSKQKSTLPDRMHEDMYISNILHHASMSGIIDGSGKVDGLSRLLSGKHTTSVSDFNKRMQLLGNKMIPLDPESFVQSHPDGQLNTIYVNDRDLLNHKAMNGESNIDGGQLFRESFTKNMMRAIGLPDAWHFKPVVVGRGEQGMYATKSNGQVASPAWRKFMKDNNIDRVVFGSSFKIRGEHNMTPMKYENGQYSSEKPTIYKVPIKDMQVSLGTFENMHKAIKGAEIPLQMFNQFDWENPTFAKEFYSMVKKSHEGTDAGKVVAMNDYVMKPLKDQINKNTFKHVLETSKVDIRELPLDFVLKHLFHADGDKKIGAILFDKINKLDIDGELDIKTFEGGDADYSSYHEVSERIKMANEGNYFTRLSLFKKEQLNSINKFVKSRWSNPMINEGGKSWLKSYTPDMVSMMEVDPKWKTKSVKEGHIYLDNAFRKMSVVLLGKQYNLGKLWEFHTGSTPLPNGVTKKAVSEALDLVVIRTPADSPSGTRVLRLGGWTNQEGAGSITHAKDDFYLGGADKDSDSVKLFQGFSKGLKDAINTHKNDKESYRIKEKWNPKTGKLETQEPDNPKYIEAVENMYINPELSATDKFYISGKTKEPVTDIDRIIPKMLMFSPSMRLDVAKRAKKGLDSLGYTLSAKTWLSHMMDYVQHKGPNKATGEYFTAQTPWGEMSIRVREKPVHGKSRMDFFRDMGAIGVNKGADASSDPTVKDHAGARDMFFNEILKVELNGEPVKTYEGFQRLVNSNSELKAVSRSIDAVKKNNSFRRIDNNFFDSEFSKGGIKKVGKTWVVTDEVFKKINPHEGERFIMTGKDEHGLAYVDFDPSIKKGTRSFKAEFIPNKPELIDLEADLRFIQVQFSGRGAGKSNSYINRASQNMADLLGTEPSKSYTQRLGNAYAMLYKYIGADYGAKGGLKSLDPKLVKQIERNLGVLLEDIVLWDNQTIQKKLGTQRNVALDMFGKTMSQFAGIELLNRQYVDLVKRLNKTGTGYSVKELTGTLYKKTNELKKIARDKDSTQAEVEDLMNEHINWIKEKLPSHIPPDRFIQYYQTMALTPMTGIKNKRKYWSKRDKKYIEEESPVIDHIKKIHGSKFIPQRVRKEYYRNLEHFISKMEDRYEKAEIGREADSSAGKLGTDFRIKQSSLKSNLENIKEKLPKADIKEYEGGAFVHASEKFKGVDFNKLKKAIDWVQGEITKSDGTKIPEPRLGAYYGEKGSDYVYSGKTNKPIPFENNPLLLNIKKEVERVTGIKFNSMLANLYRGERDSIGRHQDNEPELGKNPVIASLSFGAEVPFELTGQRGKQSFKVNLKDGDLIVMQGDSQTHWTHGIQKSKDKRGERINLTFRRTGKEYLEKTDDKNIVTFKSDKAEQVINKVIENKGVAPKVDKVETPTISKTEGVDIMRTSKFGNPFIVPRVYDKSSKKALDWYKKQGFVRVGSREEAIQSFEDWITGKAHKDFLQDRRQAIVDALESGELQGKKLKYFKPDAKDSHAVRLAKLVVEMGPKPIETEVIGDVTNKPKGFETSPIEFLALNNRDAKAIHLHRKHINEHPVIRDNYAGWFGWFTESFSNQIPRPLSTINMKDIHAMNKYFERVTDVNDLEFKNKYFMWDPRYVDEHLVLRNVASAFKKYTFKDPVTGDSVEVMQVMSPIGSMAEFNRKVKDTGIDRDSNFLRETNKKMFEFIGNLSDKDATVREFIDWRESGKQTTPSKEILELDRLTTQFFTKLGNDYIYVKDNKNQRHSDDKGEWFMDKDFVKWFKSTNGRLNRYMSFNKDGSFNFEQFRKSAFNSSLPREVRQTIGVDGVQRYKYELKMEDTLGENATKAQRIAYREAEATKYKGIGFFNPESYIPHMNFGKTEASRKAFIESVEEVGNLKAEEAFDTITKKYPKMPEAERQEHANKAKERWIRWMHDKANFSQEFLTVKDIADLSEIDDAVLNKSLEKLGLQHRIGPLEARDANLQGYDKTHAIFNDYIDKVVNGYYKTLSAIHGDYEIRNFKHKMENTYKVSEAEKQHFKELYEGGAKRRTRRDGESLDKSQKVDLGGRKPRYKNYVDVWADYMKLHLQTVLGHQTYFPERMMYEIERGIDPLYLKDKRNLFYLTSDQNMLNLYEKLWRSKKFSKAPFVRNMVENAPLDAEARKEYFSRKIHEFGRMEAQYELMTLLANTGTWATNIVSGNVMTGASAGIRNFVNVFSKKKVFDRLLSVNGKPVLKTLDGKDVVDRKTLTKYMEERGIIDNFIQNEFETNINLTTNLKKAGVNIKNFKRDLTIAMKGEKGKREESIGEVVSRYGVKDIMLKYGSFFMRHSEQVNRVNSYMAHAMQAVEKFGPEGRELSIKDDWVHEMAMKGIENTQFLYQNSFRPMFMRTATGKVLTRFKLFAWNSIRTRREFYRQAEIYGFKRDTIEFNRAKDLFLTDMFMMALGGAFMFSIFDTALAPPYDWIQAMADWMYGDKRERDMAFFGSKLGPANLLKPPIARIPQAMGEILTGDMEKFAGYTAYTLFPFGRMARQVTQLADDRIGHGLERAPEILLRVPYNQIKSRIKRAKRRGEQQEEIDNLL